jgi:hypothetical protein
VVPWEAKVKRQAESGCIIFGAGVWNSLIPDAFEALRAVKIIARNYLVIRYIHPEVKPI